MEVVDRTRGLLQMFRAGDAGGRDELQRSRIRRVQVGADTVIVPLIALAAFVLGSAYARLSIDAGIRPQFYQVHFGPAVSLACGHGYGTPAWGQVPALDAFLSLQTRDFDCSRLSGSFDRAPLTDQQVTWRYLITALGLIWRATGVSWSAVPTFAGALFGLAMMSAYFLFRVCSNTLLAVLGTLYLMGAPLHLTHLLEVRDYSKAPFLIASFGLLLLIITEPLGRLKLWTIAATAGVVLGIGAGFRSDVLVAVPAFVATVLVFARGGWRHHAIDRIGALAVGLIALNVSAAPLLRAYAPGGGANLQHVVLLGFAPVFSHELGLQEDVYTLAGGYDDSYIEVSVMDYAVRRWHVTSPFVHYDRTYDHVSNSMLWEFARVFPADLLVRAYASALRILRLPASSAYEQQPLPYIDPESWLGRAYAVRKPLVAHTIKVALVPVVAAILLLGYDSIKQAAGVAFLIAYFSFYPATQFWPRHYFHLDVIAVAAALFTIYRLTALYGGRRARLWIDAPRLSFVGLLMAITVVMLWAALIAARRFQDAVIRRQIETVLASEWQPIALTFGDIRGAEAPSGADSADGSGHGNAARLPTSAAEGEARNAPGIVRSEYLRITLTRRGGCPSWALPVTVSYEPPFRQFTRTLMFPSAANRSTTDVVFPLYYGFGQWINLRPDRIEIPDLRDCALEFARASTTEAFPLLLTITATPDWREKPLHQVLVQW
jgi:hypothetical protein